MLSDWLPFLIYAFFAAVIPASMIAFSFVFATRLTRLTRVLRETNPAVALIRAGLAAPDWAGGKPAALDRLVRAAEVVRQILEVGREQREQRTERAFVAAVRRGGDEHQMALRFFGELRQKFVPLMSGEFAPTRWLSSGRPLVSAMTVGAG